MEVRCLKCSSLSAGEQWPFAAGGSRGSAVDPER